MYCKKNVGMNFKTNENMNIYQYTVLCLQDH